MTTNNLVDLIYSLNDVKDEFWRSYLERIRNGMKVSWYHSAGFDLRPIRIISRLSNVGYGYHGNDYLSYSKKYICFEEIGKEIRNTDIVYSNIGRGMGIDLYPTFLKMWKKKRNGFDLSGSDLPDWFITHWKTTEMRLNGRLYHYSDTELTAKSYSSIEPFSLFTQAERAELTKFYYGAWCEFANPNREYDGFAIKLSFSTGLNVTIIYLCLDNALVGKLFKRFNIEIVSLFENQSGAGYLDSNFIRESNVKYIFSDEYRLSDDGLRLRDLDDYIVWDFWRDEFCYAIPKINPKKTEQLRGNAFCLAVKKGNQAVQQMHDELKLDRAIAKAKESIIGADSSQRTEEAWNVFDNVANVNSQVSTYPLLFEKGHIFTEINDELWLIDTGAPTSFGNLENFVFCNQQFKVLKNFHDFTAETISQYVGVSCVGVVGGDVLNRFDVVFNVSLKTLVVSADELTLEGRSVHVDEVMGIPIVSVQIEGKEYRMIFDTGAQISYFQSDSITLFPSEGTFEDFHLTIGHYRTETYNIPISLSGGNSFIIRCGTLPDSIGVTLKAASAQGIIGNEIFRERIVGYFARRKMMVISR